jgi:hypothetical protein
MEKYLVRYLLSIFRRQLNSNNTIKTRQCATAAALEKRMPPLPTSVSVLAVEFFTQLKAISSPMQHSQAAAARSRLDMYAALNNLSKPGLCLTYC